MIAEQDYSIFVRHPSQGVAAMDLVVEGVHCGSCMSTIEKGLKSQSGVRGARVNLASKRLTVEWDDGATQPGLILERLGELGFPAFPFASEPTGGVEANEERRLLRCLGVAAFAMMNIMLLSVSVWSGGLTDATRDMFHWISALIALPAAAYAGRPFFDSAVRALRQGAFNMDVPISLGVLLALVLSVVQTLQHSSEAYFDSAIMLLMFLLAGRTLDQRMRRKTREVAGNLAAMKAESAIKLFDDEEAREVPIAAIRAGDMVLVRPGERISVDGIVETGRSEVDQSLVTGETAAIAISPGQFVYAGTINMTGALRIRVRNAATGTLLDEVNALLAKAVEQRSSYVRLADRAARLYAPLVHVTALATFVGWLAVGLGWQAALVIAITVLIITCPCALGLAVPAVQVVAASAMFRRGILLNSGDALERLASVDTVVFDKTGTLTLPQPGVANLGDLDSRDLELAGALAAASKHPLSRILSTEIVSKTQLVAVAKEVPGEGVEACVAGEQLRLGSAAFCDAEALAARAGAEWPDASLIFFRRGERVAFFAIRQALRPDACEVVKQLAAQGVAIEILSGDRAAPVAAVAQQLAVTNYSAGLKPTDKIARLELLKGQGHSVLMVGDGINDAPALAAAHVSLSPITAAHLTQAHSDGVFLGARLAPVVAALQLARKARRLMLQNLSLSVIYNAVAVPIAIAGYATPLIAALAMSGSSILVTLNALRARSARGLVS